MQVHQELQHGTDARDRDILTRALDLATSIRLQSEQVKTATMFRDRIDRIHEVF